MASTVPTLRPPLVESPRLGDLLKYEAPNLYSREQVRLPAGDRLLLGTVLGRSEDGRYVPLQLGGEMPMAACAVLAQDVESFEDECIGVAIVRHATVSRQALVWPPGIHQAAIDAAVDQLAQRGIVVRDGA
jgi:hypothetical protein